MGNHKGHFACQVGLQCLGNSVVCTDCDFSSCEYLSEQEGCCYRHRRDWSRNGGQGRACHSRVAEKDFGCGKRDGSWSERPRSAMRNIKMILFREVGMFTNLAFYIWCGYLILNFLLIYCHVKLSTVTLLVA